MAQLARPRVDRYSPWKSWRVEYLTNTYEWYAGISKARVATEREAEAVLHCLRGIYFSAPASHWRVVPCDDEVNEEVIFAEEYL